MKIMNKKILLILGIVIFLVSMILYFSISKKENTTPTITATPTPIPTLFPSPTFFDSKKYQGLIYQDPNGNFQISYISSTKEYSLLILGYPFTQFRTEAENTFVSLLKTTNTEACKLNVSVSTPYFANPDESGKTYPLSFCPQP